jgi:hypothetical protein
MTYKKFTSLLVLTMAITSANSVMAKNISPANQNKVPAVEECDPSCSDFSETKECQELRKANQLHPQKKNNVWPHYSAAVLEELEC